ncbi:MAG: flagellar basal body rod protein FlgB [Deltaproteobacteria bacterium]|jgi:flagellar basal-body rod protein FlgB|nr:flagellar basal body rod protein FlgB [Deltaproteobacteria bacterium]MBW2491683.1 flagellar basal body rod protein FlgB [Deltaproteobacteria bacterium]
MPDKLSFGKTFYALEKAISIAQQRNALITSNISNLDTPGYKSKDIDFKGELARALETNHKKDLATTDPRHINIQIYGDQMIEPYEEQGEWNGYNWADIDSEMTKLTENNLVYRTAVEALLRKMSLLREVIREGGR